MVALVVFFISVFIDVDVSLDIVVILLGVLFLIRAFKTALGLVVVLATFAAETCFGLAHLVEASGIISITFIMVFENLILKRLVMVLLQPVNDRFLLTSALHVFQVVHIELVLQVVDVSVLLDIDSVETL